MNDLKGLIFLYGVWFRKNIMCRFDELSHDYHNPNPVTNENPVTEEEAQNPKLYWLNRGRFCCRFCEHQYPENKKMMELICAADHDPVQVAMVVIECP